MRRNEYLKQHKWAISQGKDGYWRTYLPYESSRKMVKKMSKKEVEEIVVDFYKKMEKNKMTLKSISLKNDFKHGWNVKKYVTVRTTRFISITQIIIDFFKTEKLKIWIFGELMKQLLSHL